MPRRYPMPTRVFSNGEFKSLPQTARQKEGEQRLIDLADLYGQAAGFVKNAIFGLNGARLYNLDLNAGALASRPDGESATKIII